MKRFLSHAVNNQEFRNGWRVRAHEEWHVLDHVLAGLYCMALVIAAFAMQGCGGDSVARSGVPQAAPPTAMNAERLPATHTCDIYLRSAGDEAFRDFSFDVVYPAGSGYAQDNTAHACRAAAPGAHVQTDDGACTAYDTHCGDRQRALRVNFDSTHVRSGASDLAVCRFRTYGSPDRGIFKPVVTYISNGRVGSGEPLSIEVSAIDCSQGTLSSSSTTTTLPASASDDDNNPSDLYGVEIALASSSPISSVQFEIDYGRAPGSFVGQGGAVKCVAGPEMNAIMGLNNCTSPRQAGCDRAKLLRVAIASIDALDAPLVLATCTMQAPVRAPTPRDFTVRLIEAVDPNFEPVDLTDETVVITGVAPLR